MVSRAAVVGCKGNHCVDPYSLHNVVDTSSEDRGSRTSLKQRKYKQKGWERHIYFLKYLWKATVLSCSSSVLMEIIWCVVRDPKPAGMRNTLILNTSNRKTCENKNKFCRQVELLHHCQKTVVNEQIQSGHIVHHMLLYPVFCPKQHHVTRFTCTHIQ